jgi:hypothetical protein
MVLKLKDGGQFEATTAKEVVESIWHSSRFDNSQTAEEFMKSFAERSKLYDGKEIETNDYESFLSSIIASGFGERED